MAVNNSFFHFKTTTTIKMNDRTAMRSAWRSIVYCSIDDREEYMCVFFCLLLSPQPVNIVLKKCVMCHYCCALQLTEIDHSVYTYRVFAHLYDRTMTNQHAYSCTAHANNHFGWRYTCVNLLSLLLIPVPHSTCCSFFLIGLEAWFCSVDYFTLLYKLLAFSLSPFTPCLYLSHILIHLLKS